MPGNKPLRLAPGVVAEVGATPKITEHVEAQRGAPCPATSEEPPTHVPRPLRDDEAVVQVPFDHIYPVTMTAVSHSNSEESHFGVPWSSEDNGGKSKIEKQIEQVSLRRLKHLVSWSSGLQYAAKALLFLVCILVVAAIFWHFVWSAVVGHQADDRSPFPDIGVVEPSSLRFLNHGTTEVVKTNHPYSSSMRIFNATKDIFRVDTSMRMFNATTQTKIARSVSSTNATNSSAKMPSVQSALQIEGLSQQLQKSARHALQQEHLIPSGPLPQQMSSTNSSDAAHNTSTIRDLKQARSGMKPQHAVLPDHPGLTMARALLDMVPSWRSKSNQGLSSEHPKSTVWDPSSSPIKASSERRNLILSSHKVQGLLAPRDT